MVKYILFLLLSFSFTSGFAQNNPAEAKAAYLLAEEEYNAGKYESAISFLNQATEKLGVTNAKILYLKILALQPLAQKDATQMAKLNQAIADFEKAPDIESFNEEKKLEVYKLKLRNQQLAESIRNNELEMSVLKYMNIGDLKLGIKLSELQKMAPAYFTKSYKVLKEGNDEYSGVYQGRIGLYLTIKNGLLYKIGITPPNPHITSQNLSDEAVYTKLVNDIKQILGGEPTDTVVTDAYNFKKAPSNTIKTRTVTWTHHNIQAVLTHTNIQFQVKGKTDFSNSVVLSLIDTSN